LGFDIPLYAETSPLGLRCDLLRFLEVSGELPQGGRRRFCCLGGRLWCWLNLGIRFCNHFWWLGNWC
jgi:hypothetical protein